MRRTLGGTGLEILSTLDIFMLKFGPNMRKMVKRSLKEPVQAQNIFFPNFFTLLFYHGKLTHYSRYIVFR